MTSGTQLTIAVQKVISNQMRSLHVAMMRFMHNGDADGDDDDGDDDDDDADDGPHGATLATTEGTTTEKNADDKKHGDKKSTKSGADHLTDPTAFAAIISLITHHFFFV